VVPITSFLSSARGLELLLFDGAPGSPAVTMGSFGSLSNVGGRPLSTSRVMDCHLVEELGFLLLVTRDVTLLQEDAVLSAELLCALWEQGFWCHLQISRF
jgi:hypothetical protein